MVDSYFLHLVVAAIAGASVVAVAVAVAVSTVDRKTLVDYARRCRGPKEEEEEEERRAMNRTFSSPALEDDHLIPPGLSRLHVLPEGSRRSIYANSSRPAHAIRPTSPNSPVVSAFGSLEGSDEEDIMSTDATLDNQYLDTNGNLALPDHVTANGDSNALTSASIIRSHSVSGDQPVPVAADILRKEPEHETFVRLNITPIETPSADEAEVYKILQDCLELREKYVFTEEIAPWEKEVITDPSTPKPNPNPFAYSAEQRTDVGLSQL